MLEKNPPIDPSLASPDQIKKQKKEAEDRYSAAGYMCGLDRGNYQGMVDNLVNAFLSGQDIYPKSKVQVHKLITGWSGSGHGTFKDRSDGVNFATIDEKEEGDDARIHTTTWKLLTKTSEPVVYFVWGKNHWHSDCTVYKAKLTKKRKRKLAWREM